MAHGTILGTPKHMHGRWSDIALSFVVLTLPMLLFSALLLGLVFHYRVTHTNAPFENLQTPGAGQDEPGVYYVRLNATLLVFIGSWSSSVAPMLASFVLALAAYPMCRKFLHQARFGGREDLPTPYQLALTLRFMNGGGFGALWGWLKYVGGWRRKRVRQTNLLNSTVLVTILAILLGVIVFMADTWLHVTTKTVDFIQTSQVTADADYSLSLQPQCWKGSQSFTYQFDQYGCSLSIAATNIFLVNGSQSLQVLSNTSSAMSVFTYNSDRTYTYLGIPPSDTLAKRDYTATTFGMNTECKPISAECNLNAYSGASTPFKCSNAFFGDVTAKSWQTTYLTNSTMGSNDTVAGIHNPYYFGLAALVNSQGGGTNFNDSEIVTPVHGGTSFVLLCTVTMYDIEYDSVNGTLTRFTTKISNDTVANIWQGPTAFTSIGTPNLQTVANLAAFSKTAQELANKIAVGFSQVALAVGAQAIVAGPALAVQERESFLVARVPAAPLLTLVVGNLLFVLLGIILAGIALSTAGVEVREVQARLSIAGLVADRFESSRGANGIEKMEEYFGEYGGDDAVRVAIDRDGNSGYVYKAMQ